jgi:hypothetical protein
MAQNITTLTREEFMLFGNVLAEVVNEHFGGRLCVISMGGDSNSGKSPLALAGDAYFDFDSERYPHGVLPTMNVHDIIGDNAKDRKSVFFNDGLIDIYNSNDATAQAWLDILEANPQFKIVYLSNVWNWDELTSNPTDAGIIGRNRIPVQIQLDVIILDEAEFARGLTFRCYDTALETKIKARFYEKLKQTQPDAPSKALRRSTTKAEPQNDA